ncbi:MAG: GldG family protein [Spirochaetaceae bacterium]|nr:GldG family protein [Spirochaetaceae bacterium]
MDKKQTIVITTLSLIILVLILLISGRIWTRIDLTENKSWTISPVSKQLADEMTDEVRITYFVTDKLKQLYGFPGEIKDLITEYVSFSQGKISYAERDPAKFGLVEKMEELGIPAQELQVIEKDQASFSNFYTGILIEYQDKQEVLPFVYRLDTLEYDITNRIRSLIREKERTLGIIIGDVNNAFNTDNQYQNFQRTLTQAGYRVRTIPVGDEIPDTLNMLFVIGNANTFDDWALYRIDRYIQLGGKVFFAVRSVTVSAAANFLASDMEGTQLLEMLKSYGVEIQPALALDPASLNMIGPPAAGRGGLRTLMRYPFFVHVLEKNANTGHPITSVFGGLDLYWPSPITIKPQENVETTWLFTTTEEAWLQESEFIVDPQMALRFGENADTSRGVKQLGVTMNGTFPSYWRTLSRPVRENSDETLPDLPAEPSPARLVVVGNAEFLMGNVDFVSNRFTQTQPNLDFAVLAADWLSNDDDIISIRNRTPATPLLDKIIDDAERAAAFGFARLLNLVFIPLVVLTAGVLLSWRRKKAAARFQAVKEDQDAV